MNWQNHAKNPVFRPFDSIKEVLSELDMILIMSVHPGFGGQRFIEGVLPKIEEAKEAFSGDISCLVKSSTSQKVTFMGRAGK